LPRNIEVRRDQEGHAEPPAKKLHDLACRGSLSRNAFNGNIDGAPDESEQKKAEDGVGRNPRLLEGQGDEPDLDEKKKAAGN
jgi:hypothetical protein